MSNPRSIDTCKWCNQLYCWECANAIDYMNFCSRECEKKQEAADLNDRLNTGSPRARMKHREEER